MEMSTTDFQFLRLMRFGFVIIISNSRCARGGFATSSPFPDHVAGTSCEGLLSTAIHGRGIARPQLPSEGATLYLS